MTTKEVLNLDCRKVKNQEIIQKVLKQIKPLSRYSDECEIPFEAIIKAITVMCKKYCVQVKDINPDFFGNNEGTIWRATIINDTNFKIIEKVYGITLYELFAKVAIQLYAEVRKGIKIRNEEETG